MLASHDDRRLRYSPEQPDQNPHLIFSENDAGLGDLALHFGSGGRWLLREGIPPITVVPAADHDMTPPEARRTVVERVSALVGRRGAARGSDAA